jgi:hypothetical protein
VSRQLLFLAVLSLLAAGCSDSTLPGERPNDAPPAIELSLASFGTTRIGDAGPIVTLRDAAHLRGAGVALAQA